MIKNKIIAKEDVKEEVNEMEGQIQRLETELELKQPNAISDAAGVTNNMLMDTLSKLRTEQEEHLATAQKGFILDDVCKAREKQIRSSQLIIQFKESALVSYRKGANNAALEAEKAALQEEVAQLKRQLDSHPEMLKIKAENLSLREMLKKYEKYQAGLEEQEEQKKKDKEYFHCLSKMLQELGRENEALRTRLGSVTPKGSILDSEEIDFPKTEEIEDIMQESPPKVRDAHRRFSNDMMSLLQRVTKSRRVEYRRLSGNLGIVNQTDRDKLREEGHVQGSPPATNISNDIAALLDMHNEDAAEVKLLKRDLAHLKSQESVLLDEKANLERELGDTQFQLITMEKCLEQATNHAEQLGRDLQSSRHALSNMEQEASLKIKKLNKEMQEQVQLVEKMRQASVEVQGELDRLRESHREVDLKLKIATKDLDDQRQRLIDNQKEYERQTGYNTERIKEFQQKELQWDIIRRELLNANEKLEKHLEQERIKATSTLSELEKENLKLSEEFQQLVLQRSTLEESRIALEKELDAMRKAAAAAAEDFRAKSLKQMEEYETGMKAKETNTKALESHLKEARESLDDLRKEFEAANQAWEAKAQKASQALDQREQQLEHDFKAAEAKHIQDLTEREIQVRSDMEQIMQTTRQSLVEAHEQEVRRLQSEALERNLALDKARITLKESIESAEKATEAKQKVVDELSEMKRQHRALEQETDALRKERADLRSQIESVRLASEKLDSTLEEQKQELTKWMLRLQEEQWEKERLETTIAELQDKASEMACKVGETEYKLEQVRDSKRVMEMEYKIVKDELEYQLSNIRNELVLKTNDNALNVGYGRKFREPRAQFADLVPAITERQRQGLHEWEQDWIFGLVPSQSFALSSDALSGPNSTGGDPTAPSPQPIMRPRSATPVETSSLKRRAGPTEMISRKRQTTPASREGSAPPTARSRSISSSSLNPNSTSTADGVAEMLSGPRVRAKAAADAALAAKAGRRFPTSAPTANRFPKVASPVTRVAQSPTTMTRESSHDGFSRVAAARPREVSSPSSTPTLPVIGSATAQRALDRKARLVAAAAAAKVTASATNTKNVKGMKDAKGTLDNKDSSSHRDVKIGGVVGDASCTKDVETCDNDEDTKGTTDPAPTRDLEISDHSASTTRDKQMSKE
ncbi:hypothetical protein BGX34_002636 [Mortierella sp. NVP85]|nr:hypothetical protein BGX34_002636 [Mortierella sp. NVP85]